MTLSRRSHLQLLAALPFTATASPALGASNGEAFVGTWSGISSDASGDPNRLKKADRVKLVISAKGEVTVWLIDSGLLRAQATRVRLEAPTVNFEFLGVAVHGTLVGPDLIEATGVGGGKRDAVRFMRGDLYPVNLTKLPAGLMTGERLRSLLLLSEAPGIGVGWAFKHGSRTVMVDGVRMLGTAEKIAKTDAWHIGSCTKSMTATLAARAIEAGELKWTDTVVDLLGGAIPTIRPEYRQASLIDLLSHHAGLPREAPSDDMRLTFGFAQDLRTQRLAYAQRALEQPSAVAPRTKASYSNAGYDIVGAMLEQSLRAPWETLIRERVFEPLGMNSAGFGPPVASRSNGAPVGHARASDGKLHAWREPEEAELPAVFAPSGLVHVALDDLLSYLEAHRDRPTHFLARSSWHKLHTPSFHDGYALGWGVDEDGSLSHTGSNGMWMMNVLVDKPTGMVFAGALNASTPEAISVLDQASDAALRCRNHSQP